MSDQENTDNDNSSSILPPKKRKTMKRSSKNNNVKKRIIVKEEQEEEQEEERQGSRRRRLSPIQQQTFYAFHTTNDHYSISKNKSNNRTEPSQLLFKTKQQPNNTESSFPSLLLHANSIKRQRRLIGGARDTIQRFTQCNCKRSHCLKLYCECFASGTWCSDATCNCSGCANKEDIRSKVNQKVKVEETKEEEEENSEVICGDPTT
eukprot:13098186-Ditylum_brightwellii.AAC.1